MKPLSLKQGFTLVEMIVSIGLFTIVLFIATSAFLSVVNADRKSRAVRIATDNLNLALEDIERRVKTGSNYFCGSPDTGGVQDCSAGGTALSFTEQDGTTRTTYAYDSVAQKIMRTQVCPTCSGIPIPVTAPEISIANLKFIVQGSTRGLSAGGGDTTQPYATIVIDGAINPLATDPAYKTTFKIQTTVTQRNYDS